jgi:hypothetical protein
MRLMGKQKDLHGLTEQDRIAVLEKQLFEKENELRQFQASIVRNNWNVDPRSNSLLADDEEEEGEEGKEEKKVGRLGTRLSNKTRQSETREHSNAPIVSLLYELDIMHRKRKCCNSHC